MGCVQVARDDILHHVYIDYVRKIGVGVVLGWVEEGALMLIVNLDCRLMVAPAVADEAASVGALLPLVHEGSNVWRTASAHHFDVVLVEETCSKIVSDV